MLCCMSLQAWYSKHPADHLKVHLCFECHHHVRCSSHGIGKAKLENN